MRRPPRDAASNARAGASRPATAKLTSKTTRTYDQEPSRNLGACWRSTLEWALTRCTRVAGETVPKSQGRSPESLAGFGPTQVGVGRGSAEPAHFDVAEAVMGGSDPQALRASNNVGCANSRSSDVWPTRARSLSDHTSQLRGHFPDTTLFAYLRREPGAAALARHQPTTRPHQDASSRAERGPEGRLLDVSRDAFRLRFFPPPRVRLASRNRRMLEAMRAKHERNRFALHTRRLSATFPEISSFRSGSAGELRKLGHARIMLPAGCT